MVKFRILLTTLFAVFSGASLNAQSDCQEPLKTEVLILDSMTRRPVSYASLYISKARKGTVSNYRGQASFSGFCPDDTLICSFTGYEKKYIPGQQLSLLDTLYLLPEAQLVDEVMVLADDAFLYELISDVKKTRILKSLSAKTYYELETFSNDRRLELYQSYNNGSYKGYDVSDLKIKAGRVALSPIEKRIFASTETSKAMYMHKLFSENNYFPESPFETNKRGLRKHYKLVLNKKYRTDEKQTVYVIGFSPKKNNSAAFSGTAWIDSSSNQLLKVNLQIHDASIYPFRPLWEMHELENVNMEITKTFGSINGFRYVQSIDFNYDMTYVSDLDSAIHTKTRALIYAYDYNSSFILPYLDYTNSIHDDYRKVNALGYNERFWKCTDEFSVKNEEAKNAFISDSSTVHQEALFSSAGAFQYGFFEKPYISWNGKRVRFRETSADSSLYNLAQGTIPAQRYELSVQLFLDIIEACDSIEFYTRTLFDPHKSYYKFPESRAGNAFINLYFDLMEVQRIKLNQTLLSCNGDIGRMQTAYGRIKRESEELSNRYFREVERGNNLEAMKKWNALVVDALGIDNVALFALENEEENN